jgi:hypothetical protein
VRFFDDDQYLFAQVSTPLELEHLVRPVCRTSPSGGLTFGAG